VSQENVEIVRAVNDAFNRLDPAAALRWVDPEIEIESHTAVGIRGAFRGRDAALKLLATFWESFDRPNAEIDECVAVEDHVVIDFRLFGRGKSSGIAVDMHQGQVITFRAGKVVRWRIFETFAEALKAVGLEE
jgi:ketosteroid isomerase-like protein